MFSSDNKENVSANEPQKHTTGPNSQYTDSPMRRPLHEWNHSEVSPISRPEISVLKGSSAGLTRYVKTYKLRETVEVPANCVSPLRHLSSKLSPNLSMLPKYSTPPSQLKNFIAKNPFEKHLKESLHVPMISPSVFSTVASPAQETKSFSWNIEEISVLNPAPIETNLISQPEEVEDSPETESKTQQMIDSYFSFYHNIESPEVSVSERQKSVFMQFGCNSAASESVGNRTRETRNVSCQTMLSLPPVLPLEVENVLQAYLKDSEVLVSEEQEVVGEESYLNSSMASLRRRLFADEPKRIAELSPGPAPSPVKWGSSLPALLLEKNNPVTTRSYGTPLPGLVCHLSPGMSPVHQGPSASRHSPVRRAGVHSTRSSPDVSPMAQSPAAVVRPPGSGSPRVRSLPHPHARAGGLAPDRRLHRIKSKARLDFSDDSMSVDVSFSSQTDMSVEMSESSMENEEYKEETAPTHHASTTTTVASMTSASMVYRGPCFSEETNFNSEVSRLSQDTGFSFSTSSIFSSTNEQQCDGEAAACKLGVGALTETNSAAFFAAKRDERLWRPSSKHIVSSTPAKMSP